MRLISEIDPNFSVLRPKQEEFTFYNVRELPFSVSGIYWEDGKYRRIPEKVAAEINPGVLEYHAATAGGRARFCTDSPAIAMQAELGSIWKWGHFALTGCAGFDLYATGDGANFHFGTFIPPVDLQDRYEAVLQTDGVMREYTINFPYYSEVKELRIGLAPGSRLEAPGAYVGDAPVVYYGSSITHGGCASRPGRAYENIISRRFHRDFINLGFGGSARGETRMADYLAELPMSLFVLDYDYNAPTEEHLAETHERMYRTIRAAHPDIPIIMMSRPKVLLNDAEKKRAEIIRNTWETAQRAGDSNVYFIPGAELMQDCGDEGLIDRCHPTDLGFASIARTLGDKMAEIYEKQRG